MKTELYAYGMKSRGYAPLAQPSDVVEQVSFSHKMRTLNDQGIWSIIWYKRRLTLNEMIDYELIRLFDFDMYDD